MALELRRFEVDGKTGAEAIRGGERVGRLLAALQEDEVRRPHAWSSLRDHDLAEGEGPALYRELYAVAGAAWVEAGYLEHYVVVPATEEVLAAWYSLSFAQQQVHGARALRALTPAEPEGFTVRQVGPEDIDAVMTLAFTIYDHQAEAPTWAGAPAPPEGEARTSYLEYLDDPGVTYLLAEREGQPIGHLALERESDSAVYLSIAATVPEARGLGVGHVLTQAALARAHEQGFTTCLTDWRSANLLAARFWPSQGFEPTAYRLYRSITLTPRDQPRRSGPA